MSFDIFLQGFRDGEAATVDALAVSRTLAPFVVDGDEGHSHLRLPDGEADAYGLDDPASGVMINHASGRLVWDLIFERAHGAGLAIMPVGSATAVTAETDLMDLPQELSEDAVVVSSGAELLRMVEMSQAG
jgi:hypothetical protein